MFDDINGGESSCVPIFKISLSFDIDLYVPLLQHLKKGGEQWLELLPIDRLIPIHIQEVEDVLDIVLCGLLSAHKIDDRLHYPWEFRLGEAVVLIDVEFAEYFIEQRGDVRLGEVSLGAHGTAIIQ